VIIYGINPVREALAAGNLERVFVSSRSNSRLRRLANEARVRGIVVEPVAVEQLDRLSGGGVHQGVVGEAGPRRDWTPGELVSAAADVPLVVVLDGVEDPHNVGAVVRTVDAAGGDGLIRQTRRAAALDRAAVKASAGALAHVRIAGVVNIARAIEELKEAGVWTIGLAGDAPKRYDDIDYTLPTAIVLGGEGSGLRRLVRERCDWLVSIPMAGHVASLNVSVAAGIVLFEAVRQRARGGSASGEQGGRRARQGGSRQ
jgi:23S rRNA (guanosine2251-2'-O)-methyltransferase